MIESSHQNFYRRRSPQRSKDHVQGAHEFSIVKYWNLFLWAVEQNKDVYSHAWFPLVLNILTRAIEQEKRHPKRSRASKVTVLMMWSYIENTTDFMETLLKLANKLSEVQKEVFLYSNKELPEKSREQPQFIIAIKKYPGIIKTRSRKICTLKTMKHQWQKLKQQIHGKMSLSHELGKLKSFVF